MPSKKEKLTLVRVWPVLMTVRNHLFPFRTQKLSSLVPKIVRWKRRVKIGSRRLEQKRFRRNSEAFFLFDLLQKFLLHIARTVHEKARRDRVYQKGEYEVERKSAVRAVGMFLLAALTILTLCRYQHTSAVRPKDRFSGQIPQLHSTADADGDGVDDQTDILNGALAYVSTHPKYKSRYYETGYPDDGYGVCTDVVAYALKNAGYDLQALVDTDIREHPEEYGITAPDKNIDFRRVRNLKVFFSRNTVKLTTNVSETEQWQGGDIVIFERHIGIVSDWRNKNGVPYVIHHNDPWQTAYEQDVLEKRTDIVGHYRISE